MAINSFSSDVCRACGPKIWGDGSVCPKTGNGNAVLQYHIVILIGNLLSQYLKSNPDFLKASTINIVRKQLNLMDSELEKKRLK